MRSIAGWVQQAVPGRAGPSPLLRPPSQAVEVLETWREHALFTRLPFPIWFHFYWPEGSFLRTKKQEIYNIGLAKTFGFYVRWYGNPNELLGQPNTSVSPKPLLSSLYKKIRNRSRPSINKHLLSPEFLGTLEAVSPLGDPLTQPQVALLVQARSLECKSQLRITSLGGL